MESRLRLPVAIKEKRVGGPPFHRPAIQPRLVVGDAPQRNPVDHVAVLPINSKQIGIPFCQSLLHTFGKAIRVGVELSAILNLQ